MKKFDLKKLLVLLLVLAMTVTVLAACGPKKDPTPTPTPPDDPIDDPIEKVTLADKQAKFFSTMFSSADQIGKISVDKAGNIYLKLGIGLDLQIGTGSKLPLIVEVQAYVDRNNIKTAEYVESDKGNYIKVEENYVKIDANSDECYVEDAAGVYVKVEGKYVTYDAKKADHATLTRYNKKLDLVKYLKKIEPTAENASALNISVLADQVDLISLYYDVADKVDGKSSGIVYATIGGNKVKIDVSDYQEDIDNVVGIVLGFVDGVLENNIVDAIANSFGENFTLNGLLNDVIKQLLGGKNLADMILSNDLAKSVVGGLVGGEGNVPKYVNQDGVKLAELLKAVGTTKDKNEKIKPFLFQTPTWSDDDATKAVTATIPVNLENSVLQMVAGGFEWLKGASINLGFTKAADEGGKVGKMENFFIDVKFTGLGADTTKKDLAAKISINDLKISNTSAMPNVDKSAYKDLYLNVDASVEIPENFVGVILDLDNNPQTLAVGAAEGIPTNITLNLKGGINFANKAETRVYGEIKADGVVVAKANVYYDEAVGFSVAEASVDPKYMGYAKIIYGLVKQGKGSTVRNFGWYNEDGTNLIDEDGFDYSDVNAALMIFQETGKIRLEGLDLYKLIFPDEGKTWYVNYKKSTAPEQPAEGTADDKGPKKAFYHEVEWQKKAKGIFALIVDMIDYQDSAEKTTLKIGHTAVMKYIFGDNLFKLKAPEGTASLNTLISQWNLGNEEAVNEKVLKYTKTFDPNKTYNKTEVESFNPDATGENPTFFAPQTYDQKGSGTSVTYKLRYKTIYEIKKEEAEAFWQYTLDEFNKNWISTDAKYTVTEFTVTDIEEADAFITLWADKTNNVMTKAGIDIDVKYLEKDVKVKLAVQIVDENLDWVSTGTSIFELGEDGADVGEVGILKLTLKDTPVKA